MSNNLCPFTVSFLVKMLKHALPRWSFCPGVNEKSLQKKGALKSPQLCHGSIYTLEGRASGVNRMTCCECADSFALIFSDPAPSGSLPLFLPSVHHHHRDIILLELCVSFPVVVCNASAI